MISKKKGFFLFIIFIFFVQSSFSKNFSFTFVPYTGFEISSFEEAYYHDKDGHTDDLASMLTWEQKPSVIFGLLSEMEFKNFQLKLDCSTKLPVRCGSMYDSDYWENGLKFNYSVNENNVEKAFDGKIIFSYNINLKFLNINPELIASYSYISFNARNGYGWYGDSAYTLDGQLHAWDSEYAHYFPDGKYHLAGIDYENQTFYFMTGVSLSHVFFKKWRTGLGLYFAPFTYTYVKDHHLGKSNNFTTEDYIYNYFRNFRFTFQNDFIFNKRISLVSIMDLSHQLLTKGEDYKDGGKNSQEGGASFKALKFKLGVSFSF